MITLIVLFILIVLALLILPFAKDLMKDKQELRISPIEERYKVFIDQVNRAFLDGRGTTLYPNPSDNRLLNLHSEWKAYYLIQLYYSTGTLTVFMNYKCFHKEMREKVPFYNVRNVDAFTQQRMANEFVQKMRAAIKAHEQSIGIPDQSGPIHSQYESNPLSGEEGQNCSGNDNPFDMVSALFADLSLHQRKSVINMGYLIFSADGSGWSEFVQETPVRQLLNYMNVGWTECKHQLEQEGELVIYTDLDNLKDGVYDTLLMFWLGMTGTEAGPNMQRAARFVLLNKRLGHSETEIEQRMKKMQALMNMYGIV